VARKNPAIPAGMRSRCPVANTLDLLGDRWTLLVVRDLMMFEKHRFGELCGSPEGIPTNILADRLRRLLEAGIVRKAPYQRRPTRYEYRLTDRGRDLFPLMREIVLWAKRHVPGVGTAPPGTLERIERRLAAERDPED
jgi:DNA-binding HxlR family transcriptional regulator